MANEQNLKNGKATQYRSGEEAARINGKKGGIASGKSRNLQARLKEWAEDGGYEKMLLMVEEEIEAGNTRMWELVRDTMGEKPVDKHNVTITEDEGTRKLDEFFATQYGELPEDAAL